MAKSAPKPRSWARPPRPQVREGPTIIGLTGSFGSGCTYIGEKIIALKGFQKFSLSDVLREEYHRTTGKAAATATRRDLQNFGDELRRVRGPEYLATLVVKKIQDNQGADRFIIDSIRNPAEIRTLRAASDRFFLFGVYADRDIRWQRVRGSYGGNSANFDEDDKNDTGEESQIYGQRVGDCFYEADVVLANNKPIAVEGNRDFQDLAGRIAQYVELVTQPLAKKRPITKCEALMAMAYAASQQSSCLKRKVGALIVDGNGNVVSSGFNEVPQFENPCEAEYRQCHRDWLYDDFFTALTQQFSALGGEAQEVKKVFRKKFRILDLCRALHAEESAIVNLARNGRSVPLAECTLYTTTYPCRLCANKIATLGLKHIVYMEPYPDQEAKVILRDAGVQDDFFQGVTFRAYFRIYGEQR